MRLAPQIGAIDSILFAAHEDAFLAGRIQVCALGGGECKFCLVVILFQTHQSCSDEILDTFKLVVLGRDFFQSALVLLSGRT